MNRSQIMNQRITSVVQMLVIVVAAALTTGAGRALASEGRGSRAWAAGPSLPIAVAYPAVTSTEDGRVWVFGGFDADGNALNTVRVLVPHSNHWTTMPSMPT